MVVFLWWCFCGGVAVVVLRWWCRSGVFVGGVFVVVFLRCGGVFVVVWCSTGVVLEWGVVVFLWLCFCGGVVLLLW